MRELERSTVVGEALNDCGFADTVGIAKMPKWQKAMRKEKHATQKSLGFVLFMLKLSFVLER